MAGPLDGRGKATVLILCESAHESVVKSMSILGTQRGAALQKPCTIQESGPIPAHGQILGFRVGGTTAGTSTVSRQGAGAESARLETAASGSPAPAAAGPPPPPTPPSLDPALAPLLPPAGRSPPLQGPASSLAGISQSEDAPCVQIAAGASWLHGGASCDDLIESSA